MVLFYIQAVPVLGDSPSPSIGNIHFTLFSALITSCFKSSSCLLALWRGQDVPTCLTKDIQKDSNTSGEIVKGSWCPFSRRLFSARTPLFPLEKGVLRALGEGVGMVYLCLCLLGVTRAGSSPEGRSGCRNILPQVWVHRVKSSSSPIEESLKKSKPLLSLRFLPKRAYLFTLDLKPK